MVWSTLPFSTLTQFGAVGTNQLYFAALANGASAGLCAFTSQGGRVRRCSGLGDAPLRAVLVKAWIQSAAEATCCSSRDRDREVGAAEEGRHVLALDVARHRVGAHLRRERLRRSPAFGLKTYGHSQPLPMNEATWPWRTGRSVRLRPRRPSCWRARALQTRLYAVRPWPAPSASRARPPTCRSSAAAICAAVVVDEASSRRTSRCRRCRPREKFAFLLYFFISLLGRRRELREAGRALLMPGPWRTGPCGR